MDIYLIADHQSIYETDSFQADFNQLFKKDSGNKKRYLSWLDRRLHMLEELGTSALETVGFERLEGSEHLCAIRYPRSKRNPRVIYVYADGENVILLTAFMEKSRKDYKPAIDKSEHMVKQLKEMGVIL